MAVATESRYRTCAVCKHEWVNRGKDPERCPSTECRSKRWRTGPPTELGENLKPKNSKKMVSENVAPLSNFPVPKVRESPERVFVPSRIHDQDLTAKPMEPGGYKHLALPKPTAAELAAKLGIKTLATIEEVEPRCDPESGYIAPEFVAVPDPVSEEEAFRSEFIAEFGRQAWDRAIRIPAFKKAKWPERFEMAREQKERE